MEEKQLSEEESLQLISKMINTAKNSYYESGLGPLLWGFTNVICFALAYLQTKVRGFNLPFNPFLLMIITIILQIYFASKERKFKKAVSFMEEANNYIWMAFGVSIMILTFGGGFANIGYAIFPPMLIIFAIPTFVTGCVLKFKPFIIGGIICWGLGLYCFFVTGPDTYLLAASGATVAWIIPGFILRAVFMRKRKIEHGV